MSNFEQKPDFESTNYCFKNNFLAINHHEESREVKEAHLMDRAAIAIRATAKFQESEKKRKFEKEKLM